MNSLHILITAIDGAVRDALEGFLKQRGCAVTTAASTHECLRQMRSVSPDLLVLAPPLLWEFGAGLSQIMQADPALEGVPILMLGRSSGDDSAASAVAILAEYLDHQLMRSVTVKRLARPPLRAALLRASSQYLRN